jgi:hypothetical protein
MITLWSTKHEEERLAADLEASKRLLAVAVTPDAIRDAERKQEAAGEAAERASLVRAQALEAKLVADRRKSTNRFLTTPSNSSRGAIIHLALSVHPRGSPAIITNTQSTFSLVFLAFRRIWS